MIVYLFSPQSKGKYSWHDLKLHIALFFFFFISIYNQSLKNIIIRGNKVMGQKARRKLDNRKTTTEDADNDIIQVRH